MVDVSGLLDWSNLASSFPAIVTLGVLGLVSAALLACLATALLRPRDVWGTQPPPRVEVAPPPLPARLAPQRPPIERPSTPAVEALPRDAAVSVGAVHLLRSLGFSEAEVRALESLRQAVHAGQRGETI